MTTEAEKLARELESPYASKHSNSAAALLRSQAAEIERLKAELGDLPEAQAELLGTIKELRAEAELFAKHVGLKLARKDALLMRAAKQTTDIDLLVDIETELGEK